MQIYIKRTVVLYLYLLTVNIQCLPGMLNESQDIASKLQCQLSKEVNEILQIENINQNEYGIFRTKKGHVIKFDEFNDYSLDQDVLVYIDKKVKSQYVMKLEYEKNYDIEQYVIEGRNYVYIRTQLVNMQNKQEIINLHLLNIYQQGSIKQLIQETLNGLQFSFKFKDQQDYFVQIIFATLFENDFKGTDSQVTNLVQEIQKNYVTCKINECKKDKELFHLLQNIQLQQIQPKFIKECSLKTSQSIQYYNLINSIYASQIELEKNEINFNIEFTLECIRLISYFEERNHIRMEFDQYFCIDNLIYHFRFSSIQNQQRFSYYIILIQVNNDINQNQLIEELFFLIENLKCQKNIQQSNHSLEKVIQMNSSFIQQQQNENNEGIKIEEDLEKKIFIEENVVIKIEEEFKQINTQSKLLDSNNYEKSEGIQFIQINQSQGSIPQIKQDLPLEEDQEIRLEQQQFKTQNVIGDDIFDQPLQIEDQQHQQRLNQIDQFEKKTQEIQESINFTDSNKKQQQGQKIENIVFDEYNQSRLQQQGNQVNQNIVDKQVSNNQVEHFKNKQNNHQHQHQHDLQNEYQNHYDQSHHHHNHNHNEQFRSTQYEDEQSYSEYERPIHHHHSHHHHHQFHHHNHQFDNQFQDNDRYNQQGQTVVYKKNNLRGKNFRDDSLYENNDPEIIDRIIIEYNFSQRENEEQQEQEQQGKEQEQQGNQSKKDHKKENPIPGPKKQQIQYGEDESQSQQQSQSQSESQSQSQSESQSQSQSQQNNNKNKNTQNQDKNKQSNGNQNNKSKSKIQSSSNNSEEAGNNQQENEEQTQNDKQVEQDEPKALSTQNQNNKDKNNKQQQQKANSNKNAKATNKSQTDEEVSNQNNNEDDENKEDKQVISKNKSNKQDDQENQEENEAKNENEDEEVKQQEQDQEQPEKEQEDEEVKEEQQQDENPEEQQENAQEKEQDKQKSKTKKKQSQEKGKTNKQKTKDLEEENIENDNENIDNEEELYDFNGRYIPNDPFYEHRKSKRGRIPFNYPTRDPYQDMFEDERSWRYETMKRQQVRYPFNGYPYRHRKQTVDHSPFPHVNSHYKTHPYQQQTYHCSPWVGRDFYPDTGYGMSRVTAAYKGRYTDPDQVLRDLTIKQQQQKQWKKSVQQYRDQVGYKDGDYDLDFQPDYSQSYETIVQQYPDYDSTIQDPSQFQPYEEDSQKTHDYLKDPQYKFRQGKKPLVKNDRIKPFNRQQEDVNDCFVVYDECNFQGNRLDLCGEYPDIPQYINGFKIFSFIVPDNQQIRFFQSTDFEDNVQNVEGTSDCLKVPYELVPNLQQ